MEVFFEPSPELNNKIITNPQNNAIWLIYSLTSFFAAMPEIAATQQQCWLHSFN